MNNNRISKDLIKQAKQVNIIPFLESKGIELRQVGTNEYKSIEHDSLQINSNGYFKWFSRDIRTCSDNITLIMELFGLTFPQAIKELTGDFNFSTSSIPKKENKSTNYGIQEAENQKRVIAYLCRKRKINYEIVTNLITSGKLKQDIKGNACFMRNNGSAEIHGTSDRRFKGQIGIQQDFGFEFPIGKKIEYVIYAESAIDLLSLYQLYRDKISNTLMISMSGLKVNVINHYIKLFSAAKHIVAVDNDSPGDKFFQELKETIPNIYRRKPNDFKDWNEELMFKSKLAA